MRCPACQHENRDGAKFCEECATPLKRQCASCRAELRPSAKFCDECGTPASGPPASGVQGTARKVVTIIFGDLVGSTALHERLDAESVRAFMESYYAAMRGAVEAHGGRVTQVMGDGVKAVFGAPRVAEDDAIRAVRAAVEMQRAFHALAEQQRDRVGKTGLRVAVNTGEVVADDDTEIIGDPVNVAARLQEQGKDGDVVIGGSTQRIVGSLVTLDRLGSFALKGRSEQVEAYRVVSLDPPAATKAAFVGRDEELARLAAVYKTAVGKPAAQLAVLLGSPGLGKSRLIDEFVHRLGDTASVLLAHCDAAGGPTFAPLVAALRERLRLEGGASAEAVRAALETVLPEGDVERVRIAGGVAALLAGSPASPEETFFVVRRLLAALAQQKPVVLVIDDLHWAESLLLDLVEHLVQWGSGVPLFVLVGARPELRELRSSLVTPGGFVGDVLTLAGLDAGAAMRLAAGVIGAADLPAALAAKLLATSEGNPLFVAELVKMLVQEGVLHREGERWVASAALADLEMPPTIHALLAARIERLRPEERAVLERAAVVGRHFSKSAVAALLLQSGDLDARLEALRRSELIERDTGWFLGEPVLRFHHVLIRDAAYRRVLKGTRAELHARLAGWIEAKVGDAAEHDETIGWHLEQAHQHLAELGPLDAAGTALGERAARRLAAAGRRALARDDVPVAGSLLGRALGCLPADAAERADLALDWCEALLSAGDVAAASGAIAELARAGGDSPRLRAWHTCFAGQLTALTEPQSLNATVEAVAAAAEALAALEDAAGEAKAHFVHAQALARLGKVGACEAALDRALAAARRAGDRRRANAVLAGAPLAALWGPSPVTRASGRCLDVVRVLRITQGAPAVEAVALSCQGVLEALRGRTDAARRMFASSRKLVEELGIAHRLFEADAFAGRIEAMEGDAAAAERLLRGAYEGLRDLGLGIDAARAGALLARALLAQGRAAEAEALSHESEALAGDDLQASIAWRGVRAEALAQRGEHAAAIDLAQAAVAIAAATDALLDHADARMALAAALRAAGRGTDADAEERRAIELWEAKGATLLAERARRGAAEPRIDERPAAREHAAPAPSLRRRPPRRERGLGFEGWFAARDIAALEDHFSHFQERVDHTTGAVYGRDGLLASLRSLLRAKNPVLRFEPLATLGDSLELTRQWTSVLGTTGGGFDVAAFERHEVLVNEFDADDRPLRTECFDADRLGDAIARLYARHAALLPEGPESARAAATARSVTAMLTASSEQDFEASVALTFEAVDHRLVGHESVQAEALQRGFAATSELEDERRFRVDDVLALSGDALLRRTTHSGIVRASGGSFERTVWALTVFRADGRITRHETFDVGQEAEALARFDALVAGAERQRPVRSRVRPNAATRSFERFEAALATRDGDALSQHFDESLHVVHHPSSASYGRREMLATWRSALRAARFEFRQEVLASLGDALALDHHVTTVEGLTEAHLAGFGLSEFDEISLLEVDARGRWLRSEIFAGDRLGDAIARLYERYAERLPEGPERAHAEATARSVSAMTAQPDPARRAAVFASDIEVVDHRTLGTWSARGAESAVRHFESIHQVSDAPALRDHEVLALAPGALLVLRTHTGIGKQSGGAYERRFLMLLVAGADGRVARIEWFDADREAEALARFDALVGGGDAEPASEPFENAAARADRTLMRCFNTRDWDGVLALAAEGLIFDERRRMLHNTCGREIWLEQFRLMFDVPKSRFTSRLLATRGERLSLNLHCFEGEVAGGGGPLAMDDHFALHEVDPEGRIVAIVLFDEADQGAATAELDARYEAGESALHPRASAAARAFRRGFSSRAWDAVTRQFGPDFALHDHRPLRFGYVVGAAACVDLLRSLPDLAPDAVLRVDHLRTAECGFLFQCAWQGTRDGGAFETPFVMAMEVAAEGVILRADAYGPEQLEQAHARFEELSRAAPAQAPFANAAARTFERRLALFAARDWEGFAQSLAPGFRSSDRRKLVLLELDREQYVAFTRSVGDLASTGHSLKLLATRGDRLALHWLRTELEDRDVGPSEIESLVLVELDERGDDVAGVRFDADDLDAAYAELDARYEAHAPAWMTGFCRAVTRRDWHAIAELCASDLVAEDHRLVSWGTLRGLPAYLPSLRSMVDLAPDVRLRLDHLRAAGRAELFEARWFGTRDGGAFEIPVIGVSELDEHRRQRRLDLYDLEKLDQARVRLAEIAAAAPAEERFANAATRSWREVIGTWQRRDLARFAALHPAAFRYRDRRRLFLLDLDREQFLDFKRPLLEMRTASASTELLATRGERLALVRHCTEMADGDVGASAIDSLLLVEIDEHGLPQQYLRFDLDDEAAARAELDARYAAGEAAAHPLAAAWLTGYLRGFAARDWAAMAALFAPDLVAENHRLVGWGTLSGPAPLLSTMQAQVELAPDTRERVDHVRLCERGVLFEYAWCGTHEGGEFENLWIVGVELDAFGRGRRAEVWEPEQQATALAWFEAIAARSAPDAHPFANAASRAVAQMLAVGRASGWQSFAPILPDSFRFRDRRRLALLDLDREGYAAYVHSISESRSMQVDSELVATRGERLGLERQRISLAGGDVGASELANLSVYEVDERGECVALVRFDEDDLDAAYAELETRWRAGEAVGHAAASAWLRNFGTALAARDWDAAAACFAPDFVGEDHRLVGWGTLRGPAAFVETFRAMVALAPDVSTRLDHVRASRRALLLDCTWVGTRDGGAFESPYIVVMELDALGRALRNDFYDPHHAERALARFAELATDAPRDPLAALAKPNLATATIERMWAAWDALDLDAARELIAAGFVWEDRRPIVGLSGGLELMLASVRERVASGARLERRTIIGTAGDRVAMARALWAGGPEGGRFEVEFLIVHEVDEAGLVTATIFFDTADARAAQREAWVRWARIDPAVAPLIEPLGEIIDASSTGDRARYRAQLADDLVVDDHRRTGMGRIDGPDAYLASVAAFWELASGATAALGWHWPALAPHGAVTTTHISGTVAASGGEFESVYLYLFTISRGRIARIELFELEQLDAARARFEALRAGRDR